MRLGDIFEWLAAACFVLAAALYAGTLLALAVGGTCLVYFAQCYDGPLPWARKKSDQ